MWSNQNKYVINIWLQYLSKNMIELRKVSDWGNQNATSFFSTSENRLKYICMCAYVYMHVYVCVYEK